MKKIILTFVMALFAIGAFAQNDETTGVRIPGGYQGFVELGNTLWHFDKNMPATVQLSTTHGAYFNEHLYMAKLEDYCLFLKKIASINLKSS